MHHDSAPTPILYRSPNSSVLSARGRELKVADSAQVPHFEQESGADFLKRIIQTQLAIKETLGALESAEVSKGHEPTTPERYMIAHTPNSYDAYKNTPPPRSKARFNNFSDGHARVQNTISSPADAHPSPAELKYIDPLLGDGLSSPTLPVDYRMQWEAMVKQNAALSDRVSELINVVHSLQMGIPESIPQREEMKKRDTFERHVSFVEDSAHSSDGNDADTLLATIAERQMNQERYYQLLLLEHQWSEGRSIIQFEEREALILLLLSNDFRTLKASVNHHQPVLPSAPAPAAPKQPLVPQSQTVRIKRDPLELSMALWGQRR